MYERALIFIESNKLLSKYVTRETLPQFIKYLIVGFSSTAFEFLIFLYLSSILIGITIFNIYISHIVIANSIALSIIFVYNFSMQSKWAFKSDYNRKKQIFLYGLLFVFNLCISNFLIKYLMDHQNLTKTVSKLITMPVIVSWNFVLYKKVIFKKVI